MSARGKERVNDVGSELDQHEAPQTVVGAEEAQRIAGVNRVRPIPGN